MTTDPKEIPGEPSEQFIKRRQQENAKEVVDARVRLLNEALTRAKEEGLLPITTKTEDGSVEVKYHDGPGTP